MDCKKTVNCNMEQILFQPLKWVQYNDFFTVLLQIPIHKWYQQPPSTVDLSFLLLFYSADSVCLSPLGERTRLEFKEGHYTSGLWGYMNALVMINVPTPQGKPCRITWFTPAPTRGTDHEQLITLPGEIRLFRRKQGVMGFAAFSNISSDMQMFL